MKILFTSQFVEQGKAEILSNQRWFGKDQPLITEMSDEHIRNARVWLYKQVNALSILEYAFPVKNGFNYAQWLVIFKDEEYRRKSVILQQKRNKVEELRIAAMSTSERKRRARKLLETPTTANVVEAEILLYPKTRYEYV
jgi:hypothetical protein